MSGVVYRENGGDRVPTAVQLMLGPPEAWQAVPKYVNYVMLQKEDAVGWSVTAQVLRPRAQLWQKKK